MHDLTDCFISLCNDCSLCCLQGPVVLQTVALYNSFLCCDLKDRSFALMNPTDF